MSMRVEQFGKVIVKISHFFGLNRVQYLGAAVGLRLITVEVVD